MKRNVRVRSDLLHRSCASCPSKAPEDNQQTGKAARSGEDEPIGELEITGDPRGDRCARDPVRSQQTDNWRGNGTVGVGEIQGICNPRGWRPLGDENPVAAQSGPRQPCFATSPGKLETTLSHHRRDPRFTWQISGVTAGSEVYTPEWGSPWTDVARCARWSTSVCAYMCFVYISSLSSASEFRLLSTGVLTSPDLFPVAEFVGCCSVIAEC
ncbi:hypothetical protein RUM44_007306 [Polyplax serrata]|uniref:Uncharacterized protein n=1 Tax=Polyplax serrata TaxID=468196 RepID=A0ABR1B0C0_POLSC